MPRVGHWSKVSFGKTVEIPPLPVYERCKLQAKKFNVNKEIQSRVSEKIAQKIIPDISVKKNLTKPHLITVKTQDALKKCRIDEYGMKKPWKEGFDLRVSKVMREELF